MRNGNLEFTVLVNDRPVKEYDHFGETFIEGRSGSTYALKIRDVSRSQTSRYKAIMSVDGIDVISGEIAGSESPGFSFQKELIIRGYQIDPNKAVKFEFGNVRDSHYQLSGNDRSNVGVIGCMVFREKRPEKTCRHLVGATSQDWSSGNPIDLLPRSIMMNTSNLGTEMGDEVDFRTIPDYTQFQTDPVEIFAVYYDDRKGLERRGIRVSNYVDPNPFPNYLEPSTYSKVLRKRSS